MIMLLHFCSSLILSLTLDRSFSNSEAFLGLVSRLTFVALAVFARVFRASWRLEISDSFSSVVKVAYILRLLGGHLWLLKAALQVISN